ncbi:hypothetical protein L7F22_060181 [Adiantum nelumboides]|nr:hypothetical protein [Adiantum nelumboides]
MQSSLKRLCQKIHFSRLDRAPWKLKQKLLRHFASCAQCAVDSQEPTNSTLPQKPNKIQLQEAPNQLDTLAHIDVHKYASLLNVCASSKELLQGRCIHRHIMAHGNGAHISLGFKILEMYGKCGAIQDAASWFDEMLCQDGSSWNYMMGLYTRHGQSLEALHLFDQMLQQGIIPDMVTHICFLLVCTGLTLIVDGKRIHARLSCTLYQAHNFVVTALVNFYGKCGDHDHAMQLFDVTPQLSTITWNALLSGYKQNKQCKEVLQLFDQMLVENVFPSRATFACTLSACATALLIFQGKRMHVYLKQVGYELDFIVSNALVRMYSQSRSLMEARDVFEVLSTRSMAAAKSMLAAYIHHGYLKDAIKLLRKMQDEGASVEMINYVQLLEMCGNQGAEALAEGKEMHILIEKSGFQRHIIAGNSLISMYGKCHRLKDAEMVFDKMLERDVVTWNAIIVAHSQNEHRKEIMDFVYEMQQAGMLPNEVTFLCIVDSYTSQAEVLDAPWFQVLLQHSGFCSDVAVGTALVNAYAKDDRLASACNFFDLILEPNVISWTTMITSYSLHGHDAEALQIFKQMLQQGALPDRVTFFTTIRATTSLGSVKEGEIMHVYVKLSRLEMEQAVINALVNMYGKCGYVSAALDIFDKALTRDLDTWNVLIGIYAQHGNVTKAYSLLHHLQQTGLVPDKVTSVTYLSACSRAGLIEVALDFMLTMRLDNCDTLPTLEHYDCIVDLLGRANQLVRVRRMIDMLPLQPRGLSWVTMFTVCRDLLDAEQGEFVAKHVLELDPMLSGFS